MKKKPSDTAKAAKIIEKQKPGTETGWVSAQALEKELKARRLNKQLKANP